MDLGPKLLQELYRPNLKKLEKKCETDSEAGWVARERSDRMIKTVLWKNGKSGAV